MRVICRVFQKNERRDTRCLFSAFLYLAKEYQFYMLWNNYHLTLLDYSCIRQITICFGKKSFLSFACLDLRKMFGTWILLQLTWRWIFQINLSLCQQSQIIINGVGRERKTHNWKISNVSVLASQDIPVLHEIESFKPCVSETRLV